jgi:hypothetical protein
MGVAGPRHTQTALPRGRDQVPIVQEAGCGPGAVRMGEEYFAPTRIRYPDRPARSETLYRRSYFGPQFALQQVKFKSTLNM